MSGFRARQSCVLAVLQRAHGPRAGTQRGQRQRVHARTARTARARPWPHAEDARALCHPSGANATFPSEHHPCCTAFYKYFNVITTARENSNLTRARQMTDKSVDHIHYAGLGILLHDG